MSAAFVKLWTEMMTFFGPSDCPGCEAIEDVLEDICVAHKVVVVPQSGVPDEPMPDAAKPPMLVDDDKVI